MDPHIDAFNELLTSTETAAAWTRWLASGVPGAVPAALTSLDLVVVNAEEEAVVVDVPDGPVVVDRKRRFVHPEGDLWDHAVGSIAGHAAYAQELASPGRSARGTAAVVVDGRLLVWVNSEGVGSPPTPLGTVYEELLALDVTDREG